MSAPGPIPSRPVAADRELEARRERGGSRERPRVFKKLLTFREFVVTRCESEVDPIVANERYEKYVKEYDKSAERVFFDNHKAEEWFVEHYDPIRREELLGECRERAREYYDVFQELLENDAIEELYTNCDDEPYQNTNIKKEKIKANMREAEKYFGYTEVGDHCKGLDGVKLSPGVRVRVAKGNKYSGQTGVIDKWIAKKEKWGVRMDSGNKVALTASQLKPEKDPKKEKKALLEKKRRDEKKKVKPKFKYMDNQLFIQGLPIDMRRQQIIDIFAKYPGFRRVILTDPIHNPRKIRYAWVEYETQEQCEAVCSDTGAGGLDGYKLTDEIFLKLLPCSDSQFKKAKTCPPISLHPDRVEHDIAQTYRLIEKLDKEAGIPENFIFDDDLLPNFDKLKQLNLLLAYLRRVHLFVYYEGMHYFTEDHMRSRSGPPHKRKRGKQSDVTYEPEESSPWEAKLDKKIDTFLNRPDPLSEGNTWEERTRREWLDDNAIQVTEERYRCKICKKLFKTPSYVHLHCQKMHNEMIEEYLVKKRQKTFYKNYKTDKLRITEDFFDVEVLDAPIIRRNTGRYGGRGRGRGRGRSILLAPGAYQRDLDMRKGGGRRKRSRSRDRHGKKKKRRKEGKEVFNV